jgi:hypothetical protein
MKKTKRKFLIRIQSVSDIITNSSSEIYQIKSTKDGYLDICSAVPATHYVSSVLKFFLRIPRQVFVVVCLSSHFPASYGILIHTFILVSKLYRKGD